VQRAKIMVEKKSGSYANSERFSCSSRTFHSCCVDSLSIRLASRSRFSSSAECRHGNIAHLQ
jgi:hypothetical protein